MSVTCPSFSAGAASPAAGRRPRPWPRPLEGVEEGEVECELTREQWEHRAT